MKSRSNVRDLASRIHRGAWGAILTPLLLLALSQEGSAQNPPPGLKSPKPPETLDVPYWGDKAAMENLAKAPSGLITNVSTSQEGKNLIISISASCRPAYQEFRLDNPPRLVLDFLKIKNRAPGYNFTVGNSGVIQFRIAQFQGTDPIIARMVFDLDKSYGSHEIAADGQGVRITFRPNPGAMTETAKPTVAATAPNAGANRPSATDVTKAAPSSKSQDLAKPLPSTDPIKTPATAVPVVAPAKPPVTVGTAKTADKPADSAKSTAPPDVPKVIPVPVTAPPTTDATKRLATADAPKTTSAAAAPTKAADPPKLPAPIPVPKTTPPSAATAVPAADPAKLPATVDSAAKTQAAAPTAQPSPANVTKDGYSGDPLTLDLVNFPLVDFFRLMAEEGGINIVVDPDVKGTASIKMTKTPWDQIFDVVLRNNGLEKQVDGNVVRIATKKTIQAEAKQVEDLKKAQLLAADVETRVRRLNYAKTKTLIAVLKDQMTVRGTVVEDERSGSLVITDVAGALDKVMELIDQLDAPEPQVEIEARIVSANRDFARDIGVQFGLVQGNLQRVTAGGSNTFGTIGGTRPSTTPANTYIAGNPETGRGATQSTSTQSGGVSTGPASSNNPGNYNVNLPSKLPFGGLGLSVGNILDTFMLDAAITAGESKGQAKLISQPKLTTQNNSPGVITQGLRFPVQVIANNTVTVQFQNAALTLTVTPQITVDGNIVLDVRVENNTPDFTRQVQGIPSIRMSEASTRVLVTDGGTTVIGGTLIENEQTQEDRVPGLASLPIFGHLFKRTSVSRSVQEVLFFITPRVVK